MADNYAKVFSSMYTGSMYGAGCHVFATWGWILAHKDENGHVEVNARRVGAELGATVDEVERAVAYLSGTDDESRSKDEGGRRIVRISQFGYRVVNDGKYRDKAGSRAEYWKQWRAQKKAQSAPTNPQPEPENADLHHVRNGCATEAQHDTDTDTDTDTENNTETPNGVSCPEPEKKPPARTAIAFDYDSGEFSGITEDDQTKWREAFPAVNIEIETKGAALWLTNNPTKRKKNLRRFLTNWFSRTQERGGNRGNGPPGETRNLREAFEELWAKEGQRQ